MGSPLLQALRPRQWVKNVFVLAPYLFGLADRRAGAMESAAMWRMLVALLGFCAASSAVYLLNDVVDAERDRLHPEKRHRPIAAGRLQPSTALLAAGVLALVALGGSALLVGSELAGVVALYLGLNLAYSSGLKRVVLVDAFCIAFGFLLRVRAGGVASGAEVSHWLYLCTLFLALFLALNKRRAELVSLGEARASHRANLREYSVGVLDQLTGILAACTILCYTMYTVDPATAAKFGDGHRLIWTVPFVLFGLARYLLLVQSGRGGDEPARVLLGSDPWFALNALAWAVLVAFLLWRG